MISISHPAMLHIYRRVQRSRGIKQIVEPSVGVQSSTRTVPPEFFSSSISESEGMEFHALFMKALEKQKQS